MDADELDRLAQLPDATSVPCPTCRAAVGVPCTIRRYTADRVAHLARQDRAVRKARRDDYNQRKGRVCEICGDSAVYWRGRRPDGSLHCLHPFAPLEGGDVA
ncbi:hypothetical protein ACIGO9_26735 [Nocardia asteroides]|uniref:zinc finger domain-containing protein n=1 Tax=Nocardia asteroides TaxID=1824 RepID=UPI0037CB3770